MWGTAFHTECLISNVHCPITTFLIDMRLSSKQERASSSWRNIIEKFLLNIWYIIRHETWHSQNSIRCTCIADVEISQVCLTVSVEPPQSPLTRQIYFNSTKFSVDDYSFLPARCYAERGLCHSDVSVRPSVTAGIVGLSKRRELASWFLHRLIAPWFHFLARYDSSKISQGVTPIEGDLWDWDGFE